MVTDQNPGTFFCGGIFCPVRASFAEAKLDRVSCTKYNLARGYGSKSRNVFVGGFSCPARGFRIDYAAVTEQKSRLGGAWPYEPSLVPLHLLTVTN